MLHSFDVLLATLMAQDKQTANGPGVEILMFGGSLSAWGSARAKMRGAAKGSRERVLICQDKGNGFPALLALGLNGPEGRGPDSE